MQHQWKKKTNQKLLALPVRPPAFTLWPDDVSKVDAARVVRHPYLWQVLAPQCVPKTLQLTAIATEASNANAGGSAAALTSPQGLVAAASPRREWPDDCDSRDAKYVARPTATWLREERAGDADERVTVRRSYNVETIDSSHSRWTTVGATVMSLPGERVARAGSPRDQRLRH